MKTIGERIKMRREQLGLSQYELAKKLGYKSRSSINKIESDARNLTQSKIKALADALETTPSYIMGWEEMDKKADKIADIVIIMQYDDDFREAVGKLAELKEENPTAYSAALNMINAFK